MEVYSSAVREAAWNALAGRESGYRLLVECAPVAMALHVRGRIVFANRAAAELLGATDPSLLAGRDVLDVVHPDQRASVRARMRTLRQGDRTGDVEERFVRLDGSVVDVLVSASGVVWDGELAILVAAFDVTGRRRTEELSRISATHDPLTGLCNQAQFEADMARLAAGRRFPVAVIVAGVDGLRESDARGEHLAGDVLVREVADVFLSLFRPEDTVARITRDEFAVLVPGAGGEAASRTVERIRRTLARRVRGSPAEGGRLWVGCSAAANGSEIPAAFRRADAAMELDRDRAARGPGPSPLDSVPD